MRDGDPLPDRISPSWKAPTSGGSTGRPKLIVSGDAAVWSDLSARFWRVPSDGKAAVVPGPMYHNGPFMSGLATVLNGGHLVLSERFDAAETLALVEAHQAVWLYLVPTMMSRIWRLPLEERLAFDIKTLETVWHLAAPCPEWLKRAWIEWVGGDVLVELYGGTEGIATTVITGTEYLDHPGSVGKALIGEIAILGPDGEMLPAGEVGDVGMRPPARSGPTYRYVGGDARLIGDWETIGDIGWMDEDGYLFLSDRRSDLILVGGANVYPAEVEAVIDEHPLVRSSAVVGLPDEDLGQRVHAIVQGAPGLTQEDLDAHVRARLARPKCPRSYEFVEEALRDDAGKVRRSALRDERMSR